MININFICGRCKIDAELSRLYKSTKSYRNEIEEFRLFESFGFSSEHDIISTIFCERDIINTIFCERDIINTIFRKSKKLKFIEFRVATKGNVVTVRLLVIKKIFGKERYIRVSCGEAYHEIKVKQQNIYELNEWANRGIENFSIGYVELIPL